MSYIFVDCMLVCIPQVDVKLFKRLIVRLLRKNSKFGKIVNFIIG